MPILTIRELSKYFDELQILDPMSFEVQTGAIHAVLGKNGAGKTTLLKTIAGLYTPSSGTMQLANGTPRTTHVDMQHSHVDMQHSLVHTHHSPAFTYFVPDTIGFSRIERFKHIHHMHQFLYPHWDEAKFQHLLKTLAFDIKKPLHRLSKGEERQLIMCLALASNPQLYILDEPFDGLDPQVHSQFLKWLIDDVASRGSSVLISSHHLRDIADFCDSITLLHQGKLKHTGDLDLILDSLYVVQCTNAKRISKSIQPPWSILDFNEASDHISIITPKADLKGLLHALDGLRLDAVEPDARYFDVPVTISPNNTPIYFDISPITLEQLFMHCAKEL